jgi:hypothetical protein
MAEVKVYTPEVIEDKPFPISGDQPVLESNSSSTQKQQVFAPKETQEQGFPLKMVAKELFSTAINTISKKILKTFEFAKSGALQIGEYIHGVGGEIKISPDGIVAKNKDGNTTFALDGTTGDAIFSGDVRAATFTSDYFTVDNKGNVIARSIRFINQEQTVKEDANGFMEIYSSKDYTPNTPPYDPEFASSVPNPTLIEDVEVKIDLLNRSYVNFDITVDADILQSAAELAADTTFWLQCPIYVVEIKNGTYVTDPYGYIINAITGGRIGLDTDVTGNSYVSYDADYRNDITAYSGVDSYGRVAGKRRTYDIAKVDVGEHVYRLLVLPKTWRHDGTWDSEAHLFIRAAKLSVFTLGTV